MWLFFIALTRIIVSVFLSLVLIGSPKYMVLTYWGFDEYLLETTC